MSFIYMRMKTYFHIKGWALNLVLIEARGNSEMAYYINHSASLSTVESSLCRREAGERENKARGGRWEGKRVDETPAFPPLPSCIARFFK